jgi:hypothetical protein
MVGLQVRWETQNLVASDLNTEAHIPSMWL